MSDKHRALNFSGEPPLLQLIISIMTILLVGLLLTSILVFAGIRIFGADLSVLTKSAGSFTENDVLFIRYVLIVQDLCFLMIPGIMLLFMLKKPGTQFTELKIPELKEIFLIFLLTVCVFPVSSVTGEINSTIHLPAWLSGVEKWMIEKEQNADNIIDSIVVSGKFGGMLLNLIIIALIPAVSEELIFRGILQRLFEKVFRSGHLAIWFTAVIFSAIHFQFLGFIPRLILGLVFGYLFFWGRSLWLPIISHFINNSFPVIMTYSQGLEKTNSLPDISLWKQALALPIPIAVILVILFYFRKKNLIEIH